MIDLLRFKFGADDSETAAATRRMKQQLGGIRGALAGVNDHAKLVGRSMRNIGAGLSVGVTAPLAGIGVMVRQASDSIVELDRQADLAGLGIQRFKVLSMVAGQYGVQQDKLADILKDTNDKFGDFLSTGGGPLADFFEEIGPKVGLAAKDFAGLSADKALQKYVRALQDAGASQQEMTFYMEALASDATMLLPLFRDNATAITEMSERAKELGLSLDNDVGDRARDARRDLSIISTVMRTQFATALAELVPVFADLAQQAGPLFKSIVKGVRDVADWFGALDPEVKRNVVVFGALAAAAGPVLGVLGMIALGVGGLITGFAALASPVGLVVLALGAAAGAAAYLVTQWDDLKARFPILQKAANLGQAIREKWSRLPAIKWALLIPVLRWARFIPVLRWAAFIPRISWLAVAGALSWRTLVAPLVWTARLIPGIGWVALAGALAWSLLIKKIEWGDGWIPRVEWADWIPRLSWPDWIPTVDWNRVFGGETAAEQARARAAEVGREFSAGLALGIAQGRGTGEAEIRSYLQDLENAAREESETQSPSRVFMRIGRDIMAGLGLGLREGREGVAAEMQGLAGELTSGLGTAGVDAAQQLRSSWKSTFADFIKGAASATEAARRLLSALSDLLINQALNSLLAPIASGIAGAFGFSAKGNVFSAGRMTAFAAGGIVDRPTMFPMRGGTGLMGEAGPEAIMPLARGPDGRLGVRASGGGGATNVVLNFDPVIDARGADPGQIERLERRLDRMAGEFKARVYQAMNEAARTGIDRRWAGT